MRKSVHTSVLVALTALLLVAVPSVVMSQSIWLLPSAGNSISLEVFKSDWAGSSNVSPGSSVWFLTGQFRTSPSVRVVGELSLSRFNLKSAGLFNSEVGSAVGNPYFGLLLNSENSSLIGELGVRVPVTSGRKLLTSVNGWYSEFDRWEAFIPDLLVARGRIGGKSIDGSGNVQAQILGGGTFWYPIQGGEKELFVDAVAKMWFRGDIFMFGTTFSGRALITESGNIFSELTEFQIGFGVYGNFGKVQSGIHAHFPLQSEGLIGMGQAVESVFGINITVLFGQSGGTGFVEPSSDFQ